MIARLYRLGLRAFPKRHRDLYAAEMIDAFQREIDLRRAHGSRAVAAFAIAAFANLITTGIAERRRHHVVRFGYFFSVLDFTLAWRMMLRYPGLSIVSVFGMAVGIAIATGAFAVISAIVDVRLPLPDGARIVSVIETNASLSGHEWRMLHDFASWRHATSLIDPGLNHNVTRNLMLEGRTPEPVLVAEITPSAFRVAKVDALRGRYLRDEDGRMGSDDVVVIGFNEWQRRFEGDANILGRTVRLGANTYTIVGVMPDGFGFPVNHSFWIPWRSDPAVYEPLSGPEVSVFARLAPGATLESANAELVEFGRRQAAASPRTHEHLRPLVIPYTQAFNDGADPENQIAMRLIQLSLTMLLVLVSVNVAILVYARTATRQGEIAVRGALGASRRRIVAQLFVEALMLAGVASAIGVFVATVSIRQLDAVKDMIMVRAMPFWMHMQISPDVLTFVVLLTILAAAIVGIAPALKATSKSANARLQTLSAGGGSRMQMGPLWTSLIVAQVAVTVAILPAAMFFTWDGLRVRPASAGFASAEVLSATLALEAQEPPATAAAHAESASRFGSEHAQLDEKLRADPAVVDVTYSLRGTGHEVAMVIEVEGQPLPSDPADYNIVEGSSAGHLVRYNRIATNFFDTFDVPVLLGRSFTAADVGSDRVIINRTLADQLFGGVNPLGRRVKYTGRSREAGDNAQPLDRWFEIIGVVPDFPDDEYVPDRCLYHPVAYGDLEQAEVAMRVRTRDPAAFTNRLREAAASVNPGLQVRDISTVGEAHKQEQSIFRIIGVTVGAVMLSVIILSAAGIYSLMSFTVARRRREIGIRAALGADRHRLLAGIFSRVFVQLGAGALVGFAGSVGVEQLLEGEVYQGRGLIILPSVALVMLIAGIIAAIGPARQGLSIQPIEALREE